MDNIQNIKDTVDILTLAEDLGYTVQKVGSYYTLKEHDSVRINANENKFFRNSNNSYGSVIDFYMEFTGSDFKDALKHLGGKYNISKPAIKDQDSIKKENNRREEIQDLILPKGADDNKRAYAYLTKTRGIDTDIVKEMIDKNMIYQDEKGNCVFVSYEDNKPVFCCFRGTGSKRFLGDIEGSSYEKSFYIENGSKTLVLTESVIDSMSIMSLTKINGYDYKDLDYLALSGASKYEKALNYHLNKKNIEKVIVALDNDNGGIKIAGSVKEYINQNFSEIAVLIKLPQNEKDYNDKLKKVREENGILNEREIIMSTRQILTGVLSNDIKKENIELKNGENVLRASSSLTIFHGKGRPATYVNIESWNDNAKELISNYKKGDKLTFVAHMKEIKYSKGRSTFYVIEKIDKTNTINREMDQLLEKYCDGKIDHIIEPPTNFKQGAGQELNREMSNKKSGYTKKSIEEKSSNNSLELDGNERE